MHRRSVISRLAATVAGLSLPELPELEAEEPLSRDPFSVTGANLPESSGLLSCPACRQTGDSLELTPAGLCLSCADKNPGTRAKPHSDPFWTLSRREVHRVEGEIQRLAAELNRRDDRFMTLRQQQMAEGSDVYDRAMEAGREEWHALQRELHLLHMLRAASTQFGAG
jgi:hypothetical protein